MGGAPWVASRVSHTARSSICRGFGTPETCCACNLGRRCGGKPCLHPAALEQGAAAAIGGLPGCDQQGEERRRRQRLARACPLRPAHARACQSVALRRCTRPDCDTQCTLAGLVIPWRGNALVAVLARRARHRPKPTKLCYLPHAARPLRDRIAAPPGPRAPLITRQPPPSTTAAVRSDSDRARLEPRALSLDHKRASRPAIAPSSRRAPVAGVGQACDRQRTQPCGSSGAQSSPGSTARRRRAR